MSKTLAAVSRRTHVRFSVRDSLRHLLGRHDAAPPATQFNGGDEEMIRGALLDLLPVPDEAPSQQLVGLRRRILYATDCAALWYLRAELLAVLAADTGEARARQQLAALDHLFPRGLR